MWFIYINIHLTFIKKKKIMEKVMVLRSIFSSPNKLVDHCVFINLSIQILARKATVLWHFFHDFMDDIKSFCVQKSSHFILYLGRSMHFERKIFGKNWIYWTNYWIPARKIYSFLVYDILMFSVFLSRWLALNIFCVQISSYITHKHGNITFI